MNELIESSMEKVKKAIKKQVAEIDESVKILFQKEGDAITYRTNSALEYDERKRGKKKGFQKYTAISKIEIDENENSLVIVPFDFRNTHGGYNMSESMKVIVCYWANYAKNNGYKKLKMELSDRGHSNKGFWPNHERVLSATNLGFEVVEVYRRSAMNDFLMELNISDFNKYYSEIKDIDSEFLKKKEEDKTFIMLESSPPGYTKILEANQENPPFYAKRIIWEGFDGFVSFIDNGDQKEVEILTIGDEDKSVQVGRFPMRVNVESMVNEIVTRISEYRGMINALHVPCDNLRKLIEAKSGRKFSKRETEGIMEGLIDKGYTYKEIEEESIDWLPKSNDVEAKIFEVVRKRCCYIKIKSHYVATSFDSFITSNDNFDFAVVDDKAGVIEYCKELAGESLRELMN